MRAVVLGPEQEARARAIVEHATKPENYYIIGESTFIPGDDPHYVTSYGGIRTVFSITKHPTRGLFRHITCSLLDMTPGRPNPHPTVVAEIAKMYGFTGDPRTWIPAVDSNIKFCYGFVQPYEAP